MGVTGESISKWANGIGLSASFDPDMVREFGEIGSAEYRALGITTALSPQIDLATEPRWMRFADTFGEHTQMTIDMTQAYCDGFQTTKETEDGWGKDSVNTMVKHFPGGGMGEDGRDAHYAYGKYAVYPGENFDEHLKPFTEGAFALNGKTKKASAVMPYYTISYGIDQKYGENVGNSYNKYLIQDLLREELGYDGVVCTDWNITHHIGEKEETFAGKCWGVELLTEAERHLKALEAGVDQFGGNNDVAPVMEAYKMGCEKYGEDAMQARFRRSAYRLLLNIFRTGLFENPYLNLEQSMNTVGCPEFKEKGYLSQQKSVTLLKNKGNVLPLKEGIKVYVPNRHIRPYLNFMSQLTQEQTVEPEGKKAVLEYFTLVETPEEADAAICFIESPISVGYDPTDREKGGNGYVPITLQYRPYHTLVETPEEADAAICFIESPISVGYDPTDREKGGNGYVPITLQYRPYQAEFAREHSIAGGDPLEDFIDRSYHGKWNTAANEADLDCVLEMKKRMGEKPVVTVVTLKNPMVMAELEPYTDALLVEYGVSPQAVLDVITGRFTPEGLLPIQMPVDMKTVECQKEDVAFDMECYKDTEGHVYDFGYGMNFHGVIMDERTRRYVKP